jgi:hypothetical protein
MKEIIMEMMTHMMKDVITKIKDIIIVMEDMKEKSYQWRVLQYIYALEILNNHVNHSPEMRR